MSDIKILSAERHLRSVVDTATTAKAASASKDLRELSYNSSFLDLIQQVKTPSNSEYQQNKVAQLHQEVAQDRYVIDFDALIEQLLVEE